MYRRLFVSVNPLHARHVREVMSRVVEPNTRTHYGRVGSGGARRGGWAGRARQDGAPTGLFTQDTTVPHVHQGIEAHCPEHFFGRTNMGNPMLTVGRTKRAVDRRLIRSLLAIYPRFTVRKKRLFVLGCWPMNRCLFVFVNFFHARHVREWKNTTTG